MPPRDSATTRPITDRVKQALFDRLWAMGVFPGEVHEGVEPGHAVDLFAGTGSLGLEALSRGCATCVFVERDREARRLLEENVRTLGLVDRATVLSMDASGTSWVNVLPHRPVRVVFCDPPYALTAEASGVARVTSMLSALARVPGLVEAGAVAVLRTAERVEAGSAEGWEGPEGHRYGTMVLWLYRASVRGE